jgi:hypothetical protein
MSNNLFQQLGSAIKSKIASEVSTLNSTITAAQAVDSAARTALESSLQGEITAAQAVDSAARTVINSSVSDLETQAGSLASDGNSASFSGNVSGATGTFSNLTVNGTTTTIDTNNVIVKDSIMSISAGASDAASASNDGGFIVERGSTENNVGFVWDEGADRFRAVSTSATAATSDIDGTDSSMSYVPMQASDLYLGADSINTIFTKVTDLGTASDFSSALNA